jgi:hypothetical protein
MIIDEIHPEIFIEYGQFVDIDSDECLVDSFKENFVPKYNQKLNIHALNYYNYPGEHYFILTTKLQRQIIYLHLFSCSLLIFLCYNLFLQR